MKQSKEEKEPNPVSGLVSKEVSYRKYAHGKPIRLDPGWMKLRMIFIGNLIASQNLFSNSDIANIIKAKV